MTVYGVAASCTRPTTRRGRGCRSFEVGRPGQSRTDPARRADAGDGYAAWRLIDLLAERGDLDGLRARVDGGDLYAAGPLAGLLVRQGRGEEEERLRHLA